ncbi:MAG: hypothetical protein OHK0032_08910 [Thermodesulfovibrionales bacterium]
MRKTVSRRVDGNGKLLKSNERLKKYIRDKVNQLLIVMGTKPLSAEELDDDILLDFDPIGIIAQSFEQILDHLKETNRDLRIAKDHLQAVFDTADVCISIIDSNLKIINCNEKQKELLVADSTEVIGRYCYEVYCGKDSPALDCPAIETIETGRPVFIREIKKKRRYFQIVTSPLKDSDGNVTGAIEVSMDVTEKKKAEEITRQAEKLAATGLLAAGIAHEINNPLGNILGYAKLLMSDPDITEGQKEKLDVIIEQARRGSEIIKGLLDFSSQSRPSFRAVDINELILRTVRILSGEVGAKRIKIKTELSNVPMVKADPKQIEQVIINLLLNSIHAIEGRPEGTITIGTECKNNHIEVRVIDDGPGIPDAILPRVFDPFFTTKPVGKGVGLGLSICSGIVRDHNGSISVESEMGKGTKFFFRIPVIS